MSIQRRINRRYRRYPSRKTGTAKHKLQPGTFDRHIIRTEVRFGYERRLHATKGWRVRKV